MPGDRPTIDRTTESMTRTTRRIRSRMAIRVVAPSTGTDPNNARPADCAASAVHRCTFGGAEHRRYVPRPDPVEHQLVGPAFAPRGGGGGEVRQDRLRCWRSVPVEVDRDDDVDVAARSACRFQGAL